jgi:hypothetical protein
LDFGDDYIVKLIRITTNDFWKDALESWLYVISKLTDTAHAHNLKLLCIYKGKAQELKMTQKEKKNIRYLYEKGVEIIDDFLNEKGYFLSKETLLRNMIINSYTCVLHEI